MSMIWGYGGQLNRYRKIVRKVMMNDIDPRKKLFYLINFNGAKVVQLSGELLEVYHTNLTCMLVIFHGSNTCFSEIVNLDLLKNIIKGSKLVHRLFGEKLYHCYDFFQEWL